MVFRPESNVRDVDTCRLVPRTDLVLADPRLVAAERRLGRALVKAAVGRAQQRARDGQIAPEQVADAAVRKRPARRDLQQARSVPGIGGSKGDPRFR